MSEIVLLTIILAILFDISNGWNDAANAIATVVSTRILTPFQAVLLAATMNILGALFSTAVAKTIGKGIVNPAGITETVVASALVAGFLWNSAMTIIGLPVSASHALIGSLMGSALAYGGPGVLNLGGLKKIFAALLTSPVLGIIIGYLFMKLLLKLFGRYPPGGIQRYFGRLQLLSSSFMAFSHGSNDAQKVMGIITLSLFSGGLINSIEVPLWVILLCAFAMGLGTAIGGWRVIKTLGVHMLKLEPVHGFAAETAATAIILGASHVGMPVSTTHVISTSIMGVGATKRLSAVRWGIAGKIVLAWIFTLPACILLAFIVEKMFSLIL
ncbi:MAG TPA: inorganic phosphate transporter [Nitrospirae bacterium]|nr:inorganic phosphate transporter [Nitrospirota bacterium]